MAYIRGTCRRRSPFCCGCAGGCRAWASARRCSAWRMSLVCAAGCATTRRGPKWRCAAAPRPSRNSARSCRAGFRRRRTSKASRNFLRPRMFPRASKSGSARRPAARARPGFCRIWRRARIACGKSSIRTTGASAIPSRTARIAGRASAFSRACPTTARTRRCADSGCVRRARRNIAIRATAGSTRSRTRVRSAGHRSRGPRRTGPFWKPATRR